ncbi:MAG: hypothetical protein R3B09_33655 [Nannocystaceae bacterium]
MLKRWLQKAQEIADRHLPEELVEGGRRLRERVLEAAPERVRNAARPWLGGDVEPSTEAEVEGGSAPAHAASPLVDDAEAPSGPVRREIDESNTGPKVVVFGYPEDPVTQRVWALFADAGIDIRRMNLHQQPEAARQIAGLTGVMFPPYVYIRGRFWGSEGEIVSLRATGDLAAVVDGRLEEISDEARRIGKVRQEFDDAMTADNIVVRLRHGHIVAMGDLDCWREVDAASGEERVIYQGVPRPGADLPAIAAEIEAAVEAGEVEARWLFEPEVAIH